MRVQKGQKIADVYPCFRGCLSLFDAESLLECPQFPVNHFCSHFSSHFCPVAFEPFSPKNRTSPVKCFPGHPSSRASAFAFS